MTERPFQALGLSADADRAYPLLIATRGVTAGELAREMRVSAERARAACRELAGRELIRPGRDDRWYPVPPHAGLLPLVARAQEQLRRGRELVDRLGVEYQRVHEGYRAEEIVQFVEGAAAIRARIAEAHAAARTELMAFSRAAPDTADDLLDCAADWPDPAGAGPRHEPAAHLPGSRLRRRVVVERAELEAAGAFGPLARAAPRLASAATTYVRVAESLPVRLCIADRSVALLPLAAAARPPDPVLLVIGPSGPLDALIALFEAVWAGAVPLVRPAADQPRSAVQLRILAMLVSGSTDAAMARSLGVAVRTVQRHVAAMQRDAGVDNRVQLVWHAARHGWLDDESDDGADAREDTDRNRAPGAGRA